MASGGLRDFAVSADTWIEPLMPNTPVLSRPGEKLLLSIFAVACALYAGYEIGLATAPTRSFAIEMPHRDPVSVIAIALGFAAMTGTIAWKLSNRGVRVLLIVTVLSCVGIVVVVQRQAAAAELQRRAAHRLDVPLPPPSNLHVEGWLGAPRVDVKREANMKVNGATWEASWTHPLHTSQTCTARLTAAEAIELDRVLGMLEADVEPHASHSCEADASVVIRWTRGERQWTFQAGRDCVRPLQGPVANAVFEIWSRADADRRQVCKSPVS